MIFYHIFNGDAYEITFAGVTIHDVIRYRDKRAVVGERFAFDELPEQLQNELIKHLSDINE